MSEREDRIAALEHKAEVLWEYIQNFHTAIQELCDIAENLNETVRRLDTITSAQGIGLTYAERRLEAIESMPDIKRHLDRMRQEGREG